MPTDPFLYGAHYWNFFKILPLIKAGDRRVYCGSADKRIMIVLHNIRYDINSCFSLLFNEILNCYILIIILRQNDEYREKI